MTYFTHNSKPQFSAHEWDMGICSPFPDPPSSLAGSLVAFCCIFGANHSLYESCKLWIVQTIVYLFVVQWTMVWIAIRNQLLVKSEEGRGRFIQDHSQSWFGITCIASVQGIKCGNIPWFDLSNRDHYTPTEPFHFCSSESCYRQCSTPLHARFQCGHNHNGLSVYVAGSWYHIWGTRAQCRMLN